MSQEQICALRLYRAVPDQSLKYPKSTLWVQKLQPSGGNYTRCLQPHFRSPTAGKRRTSPITFASKGEVLSLLQARASGRGMSKSTTGKITTVSGDRQRAVPSTHPTPKPVDRDLGLLPRSVPLERYGETSNRRDNMRYAACLGTRNLILPATAQRLVELYESA